MSIAFEYRDELDVMCLRQRVERNESTQVELRPDACEISRQGRGSHET